MRRVMSVFLSLLAAYLVLVAGLFLFQRSLMYHPSAGLQTPAAHGVPDMQRITIQSEDGLTLAAWYKPATDDRQTMLYLHGNAGHIGYRAGKVRPYLDAGYGVLLLSYRGFGGNPGNPTEDGLYQDAAAALSYLAAQNLALSNTVVYGESLGTGVAVELAQNKPLSAIVLEAPFTSISAVAAQHFFYVPARYLVRDRYDSASKIAALKAPILFIHGDRDRTVPQKFGRALFEKAPDRREFFDVTGAGHNNLYDFGVPEKVIDFMGKNRQ